MAIEKTEISGKSKVHSPETSKIPANKQLLALKTLNQMLFRKEQLHKLSGRTEWAGGGGGAFSSNLFQ